MPRCSWMNTCIGRQRGYTHPDSPRNVSPSHSFGKRGGGRNDPLRLPAQPPMFRSTGRCLYHPISGDPPKKRKRLATGMLLQVSWPKGIWQKTDSRCATCPRPPLRKKLITTFGWGDYHAIWQEHLYTPLWQWGSAALI